MQKDNLQTKKDWRLEIRQLTIVCASLCSLQNAFGQPDPSTIVLAVGQSEELPARKDAAIWVENGTVLKVTDLGDQIRVVGKEKGSSNINIGHDKYSVQVLAEAQAMLYQKLEMAIEGRQGLELEVHGEEIWVTGKLLRSEDWSSLSDAVLSLKNTAYRFAAQIEPAIAGEVKEMIQRRLNHFHLPLEEFQIQPYAFLSLSKEQFELASRYEEALKSFGFLIEKNQSLISLDPLVRVQIFLAEIRRSSGTRLGIQWPDNAQAQILPNLTLPGSPPSSLNVLIQAMERSGDAKVLASPHLVCRSGKEAEFFAGGEFPIKISNFHIHDVIWKKYGVLLKIKPTADSQGRMSIGVQTEVSSIDPAVTVEGIPGLIANRIESHFDLSQKQTIALSGLIKKESSDATEGLPALSKIPILGRLFGSKEWQNRKSELVVFVTPEVVPENRLESAPKESAHAHDFQ